MNRICILGYFGSARKLFIFVDVVVVFVEKKRYD